MSRRGRRGAIRGAACRARSGTGRAPVRDPEAADVADLLDAVAHPRDRQAQMRAWMTCFFDVRPTRLARAKDAPDDHPLVAHFHDWRGLAARLDYPRLFRSILDDTRVIERALATGGGTRTVTNLGHVLEHLYAEVERSRCELPELVARLRAWIADGGDRPDDSDLQRQETDQHAVQVMTVHRAKGLEAWVVFMVGGIGFEPKTDDITIIHDASGRFAVLKSGSKSKTKAGSKAPRPDDKRSKSTRISASPTSPSPAPAPACTSRSPAAD
jgi:ATP-dependent exoDNAse (exonuclease V) beta subunit